MFDVVKGNSRKNSRALRIKRMKAKIAKLKRIKAERDLEAKLKAQLKNLTGR